MALPVENKFSPSEIAKVEFPSAVFRGYEQEAVRSYLENLADAMRKGGVSGVDLPFDELDLRSDVEALKAENQALRRKVKNFESDSSFSSLNIPEEKVAEVLGQEATRILEIARSAAEDILRRAEKEAEGILDSSEREATIVKDEASRLLALKQSEAEEVASEIVLKADKKSAKMRKDSLALQEDAKRESARILSDAKKVLHTQEVLAQDRAAQVLSQTQKYSEETVAALVAKRRHEREKVEELIIGKKQVAASLSEIYRKITEFSAEVEKSVSPDAVNRMLVDESFSSVDEEVKHILADIDSKVAVFPEQGTPKPFPSFEEFSAAPQMEEYSFYEDPVPEEPSSSSESLLKDTEEPVEQEEELNGSEEIPQETGLYDFASDTSYFDETSDTQESVEKQQPVGTASTEPVDTMVLDQDLEVEDREHIGQDEEELQEEWDEVITTVAARAYGTLPDDSRGDLVSASPFNGRVPDMFKDRDLAISRSGPELRRRVKRALNDDQSDVLDRLRSGKGKIQVDELPTIEEQINRYFSPLYKNLSSVFQAGALSAGGDPVELVINSATAQLSKHIVVSVRIPTIDVVEQSDSNDREMILDPIRAIYRDFRNNLLPAIIEDALYEMFSLGVYFALPDGEASWVVDPRLDPDPLCEINARTTGLPIGEIFPSGHSRPLSLPGCRCLLSVKS